MTIDFDDWAYNPTYVRCLRRGDTASIEALESMLLDAAISQLRWADDALRRLTGATRCLTSCCCTRGAFDAHILDRLLSSYERGRRPVDSARRRAGGPHLRA